MQVDIILIDCDGVLTDGKKHIGPNNERLSMWFHARDNTAARRLIASGFKLMIVTAAKTDIIDDYWSKYSVPVVHIEKKEDLPGIDWARTIGIADDYGDAAFLKKCALGLTPADGHPTLQEAFITMKKAGGEGILEELELFLAGLVYKTENVLYYGTTN